MTDTPATADVQTEVSAGTTVSVTPAESVPVTDRTTVRIVVIAIALVVLIVVVASCLLPLVDETVPADAWDVAKMLGGALVGVLASTRSVKS